MNVLLATIALTAATLIPLNDLGNREYGFGWFGGLWDVHNTGDVTIPADHAAAGLNQASLIVPRDSAGNPDPNGKIVFLSVGYGNTAKTFDQFTQMVAADTNVNHESLVVLNGAGDHLDSTKWEQPFQQVYGDLVNKVLVPAGVTEAQVQAVWIQQINENPFTPLPIQYADSYLVKASVANTLRALKQHYPNLAVAYLSDPEYGGYDTSHTLGEPFAYEDGFVPRWVVLGQIEFIHKGEMWDPRIGDLSYTEGKAPWATWGPYMWAEGTIPRSDGLTWQRSDFESDGFTLSDAGSKKSAGLLMNFMLHEPTASHWFTVTTTTPAPARHRSVRH
ncbi:MAG TPA: hypothetical protein VF980_03475 [Thermoanaerobaculia bacterium]